LHLRESILRKTAGEKEVDAILDAYRKNNPGVQYMSDARVKGYVNHKQRVQDLDKRIASLRKAQKTQGLGEIVDGSYEKGSIGDLLMKANKERAAHKAYVSKFENERGLRRRFEFNRGALEKHRAFMERTQNASAKAFVDTIESIDSKYLEEGAVIPKPVLAKAEEAAAAAGYQVAKSEWGAQGRDEAAATELYSDYLKGGGEISKTQIKDPEISRKLNMIALNRGIDPEDYPGKRAEWQRGREAAKSGAFGKPKILGSETLGNIGERWVYGINELNPFGLGGLSIPYIKPSAAEVSARDKGKPEYQNRMRTAQTERDKYLKNVYQDKTQNAEAKYVAQRGKEIRGWLKDNWMPLAGLGMGALGLIGMVGMRGRQGGGQQQAQKTPGAGQVKQPGVDEWAQNYNFRRGPAGTPQQTIIGAQPQQGQGFNFSSVFNKFMGGKFG
jgi:hypothetical protein